MSVSQLPYRVSSLVKKTCSPLFQQCIRHDSAKFSTTSTYEKDKSYKLVVVGGGAGGCATAAMFSRKLGPGNVAVIEPSDVHYYQPLWTLVGGGQKGMKQSGRPMRQVLPAACDWIKAKAVTFNPDRCTVSTDNGNDIKYEYLVCALGLQLNYHLIKGLPEAFDVDPMLCSNYWNQQVIKTRPAMEAFKKGNAIFTFPNSNIKCAGAPQKIMYLTEEYFRKSGKRDNANVIFNTSLGVIFGVKKYADVLTDICRKRNIDINFRHNLIEVRPETKEAVFEHLDTKDTHVFPYEMMHIVPPMSTPDALWDTSLVDESGFITVNKETLQHSKYPNVFAIGDNTNVPTAKTAAAVASQTGVLKKNLSAVIDGRPAAEKKVTQHPLEPEAFINIDEGVSTEDTDNWEAALVAQHMPPTDTTDSDSDSDSETPTSPAKPKLSRINVQAMLEELTHYAHTEDESFLTHVNKLTHLNNTAIAKKRINAKQCTLNDFFIKH